MNGPINLIGNLCIALALCSSLVGIVSGFAGLVNLSRRSVYFNFFAMALANLAMVVALLTNDFSVGYVAQVGALETQRFFAAISLWSSLEGSILFWGFILSLYSALCLYVYRNQFPKVMPWVGVTLLFISLFFFIVLALPANPFVPVFPVPANGPGPNPLLQNHWLMGLHPPVLYLGYVGMSVPFAFAVASMISGELTDAWVQVTRHWILIAWMFLSAAIVLGAWWSYAVLGWGGYWAWDPVENASLMPWLTATAFLHSVMVQNRRGMLKVWNLTLIMVTFLLTILGTFLTRSGVLESVHSFTQSDIGPYFLVFIAALLVLSSSLLIWRGGRFRSTGKLDHPLSRETFFLLNNLLLVSVCFVVLLGTLYPLIVEALRNRKVSVGEPFFNQMTVPLAIAIILLIGLGSAVPWRKADPKVLARKLIWPFVAALLGVALLMAGGIRQTAVLVTVGCAIFSLSIMIFEMTEVSLHLRFPWKLFTSNPGRYGGFVVHIGMIVIALGIALSKNYQMERQVTLKEGEAFKMGGREFRFEKLTARQKPNRFEVVAALQVTPPNILLEPRLNFYPQNREPIGSPSVHSTLARDLYLTLMAFDQEGREVSIRAIVTPAVSWIWMGGGIIIVGTLIAVGLRRNSEGRV